MEFKSFIHFAFCGVAMHFQPYNIGVIIFWRWSIKIILESDKQNQIRRILVFGHFHLSDAATIKVLVYIEIESLRKK